MSNLLQLHRDSKPHVLRWLNMWTRPRVGPQSIHFPRKCASNAARCSALTLWADRCMIDYFELPYCCWSHHQVHHQVASLLFFHILYIYIYVHTYIPQWWGPNFRSDITTNVRHMMLWMPNLRSPQLWQTLNVVDWILMRLPMQLPQQEGCWKLLWWDHGGQWSLN